MRLRGDEDQGGGGQAAAGDLEGADPIRAPARGQRPTSVPPRDTSTKNRPKAAPAVSARRIRARVTGVRVPLGARLTRAIAATAQATPRRAAVPGGRSRKRPATRGT